MRNLFFFLPFFLLLSSCLGLHNKDSFDLNLNQSCQQLEKETAKLSAKKRLEGIYPLFSKACYQQVLSIGKSIQGEIRDKTYSITKESSELILYEGTVKKYVLESYERTHLAYIMALSYFEMGDLDNTKVQLRFANDEMLAQTYNTGEDELNLLLMADLWERLGSPDEALPNYRKILTFQNLGSALTSFVQAKISTLESKNYSKKKSPQLHIYAVGDFPNIIYNGGTSPFYEKYSMGYPLKNCQSQTGFLFNTHDWIRQISLRGHDDVSTYKKAVRTPFVILYTGTILAAGIYASILIAPSSAEGATLLTIATLGLASRTFINGSAPDMHYWSELPSGFIITTQDDLDKEPCAFQYLDDKLNPRKIL